MCTPWTPSKPGSSWTLSPGWFPARPASAERWRSRPDRSRSDPAGQPGGRGERRCLGLWHPAMVDGGGGVGAWPSTTNHRRLWSAVASAVPKVPGSRLVVIGTAGSPVGLGAEVWAEAQISSHWRTSRTPGPSPWWTNSDIEALRVGLSASEWRRLILCEWAEGDDALTTPEDVAACIR